MMLKISHLKQWFSNTVAQIEFESRKSQAAIPAGRVDYHTMGILVLAAVLVSYLYYYGSSRHYGSLEWFASFFVDDAKLWIITTFESGDYGRLARLSYWSATTTLAYLVIPVIWVKFVLRKNLTDFGFGLANAFKHKWVYIGLYLLVLPFVYLVSFWESFQRTYPFYEFANRSFFDFFAWQLVYGMQFLALEFFYRGFLIHGLKARFGLYSIAVSMIPYCMIHFGKPMPETLGAILAGLALGFLALYTRTIWLGVAIHISVAVTMDVLSLLAQGKLSF